MPKIDTRSIPARKGSGYPSPIRCTLCCAYSAALGRRRWASRFGVNLMTLPPGAGPVSANWHSHEDEFVYLLRRRMALIEGPAARRFCRQVIARRFPKRHRQWPSPGQQVHRDGPSIWRWVPKSARPHDLLRYRHDEFQCRRRFVHKERRALSVVLHTASVMSGPVTGLELSPVNCRWSLSVD